MQGSKARSGRVREGQREDVLGIPGGVGGREQAAVGISDNVDFVYVQGGANRLEISHLRVHGLRCAFTREGRCAGAALIVEDDLVRGGTLAGPLAEFLADRVRCRSSVLVSGGTSSIMGLPEKIQEVFGHPTEIFDPFKSITIGPKVDAAKVMSFGPALAVAVGLALRGFD